MSSKSACITQRHDRTQKKIEKKEKKMNPVSEIYERSFTGTNVLKIRINEKHSLAIGGVLQHVGNCTRVKTRITLSMRYRKTVVNM